MAADDAQPAKPRGTAIKVCARVRPTLGGVPSSGEIDIPQRFGSQKSMCVRSLEFSLDWCFDASASQEDVFNQACKDSVTSVLEGYNAAILAYGQTGSGKTHTMFGPDNVISDFEASDVEEHGIVPRACALLFGSLAAAESGVLVQASYLEVYNDKLNDLLSGERGLLMREGGAKGVTVDGLSSEMVSSADEVMDLLARGNARRVVAKMSMNARSSRGHAIFTLYVREIRGAMGSEMNTKLHLVDLAGMESSKKSVGVEGASSNPTRREEAKNINQSLCALGSVIARLSASLKAGKGAHVPWRDSKLTRLLQDSLGGNSVTVMLCNASPADTSVEETLSALRFAERAKKIENVATVNRDPRAAKAAALYAENKGLRERVAALEAHVEELEQHY